ncbi:MAG: hypothetical protein ACHQT6_05745 [Candidatus Acidiferrales bacterium]
MRRIREILFISALVVCIPGCSGLSDVKNSGTGSGQVTGVTVSPVTATMDPFQTKAFSASVQGNATNNAVTWQVNGVTGGSATTGIISSAGLYTAPHAVAPSLIPANSITGTVTITAISQANATATGTAIVTLTTQQQQTQSGAVKLGTSGGITNDANGNFCCSGTLGALVTRAGTQYILSNNHVLANSAGNAGSADVGVAITQPGLIEVNCLSSSTRQVASLSEYFPLQTGPIPKIDAALAAVASGAVDTSGNILLLGGTLTNGVPDPGPPTSGTGLTPAQAIAAPHNGAVAKSGRTTGLTCSTIIGTNVASSVGYFAHCGDANAAFTVNYTDLVAVNGGDFSDSGDSGSLIVTQDTAEAVALLFAGSNTDSVGNPITDVLPAFPGAGNVTPTLVGGTTHQVIGCTLPALKAVTTVPQVKAVAESIQQASAVRDLHSSQLLTIPAIKAVAVGESYDHPGKAAILLFVGRSESLVDIPRTIDGVRTRLIEGNDWAHQGLLNSEESADLLSTVGRPQIVYPLQQGEYLRAKTVHTAHVTDLLKQAGILGVGITSSVDAPGEAALLIYVLRGASQDNIPAEIDGLRTRVRETSPFTTGRRGNEPSRTCKMPAAKSLLTQTNP